MNSFYKNYFQTDGQIEKDRQTEKQITNISQDLVLSTGSKSTRLKQDNIKAKRKQFNENDGCNE